MILACTSLAPAALTNLIISFNVVPYDDLGLRKAVAKAYRLRKLPDRDKFSRIAKKWHPYGTIASLYLWRSMD